MVRESPGYWWSDHTITISLEANVLLSRLQNTLSFQFLKEKSGLISNFLLVT